MRVLVVNSGSRSVKLRVIDGADQVVSAADLGTPGGDLDERLSEFLSGAGDVDVIGHRVVHGGRHFTSSVVVDRATRDRLAELNELAPLHNPPALAGIDAVARLRPRIPSVACFDTAFHAALPAAAATYAIPHEWILRWGIRRYGFHGLSCAYATRRAAALLGQSGERLRLVICHLGGGASVTAVADGRSADTTMGFTPLEGLVMATRPGDLDPGLLLWVLSHGISLDDAGDDLEHHSGLSGLTGGRISDMRELLERRAGGDGQAGLAVSVFVHRLRAKIAAMTAATQGTDAVVFTGGIGENSPAIRAEAAAGLEWMGLTIDGPANASVGAHDSDISATGATVATLVIHAREDLEIAGQCRQVLSRQLQ
jgi:acetate kinase